MFFLITKSLTILVITTFTQQCFAISTVDNAQNGLCDQILNSDPFSIKLKMAYEKLLSNYPNNSWTKRASPYRLI